MIKSPFFFSIVIINPFFFFGRFESDFDNEKGPKEMHCIENESHSEEIVVLKADHFPSIIFSGSI